MPLLNSKIPKTLDREYNVAIGKHSKADELLGQGKVAEAESLLRAALNWSQQSLGGAHEMTVSFQEDLAVFLAQVGKFDEAIEVNMAAWQTREKARDSSRSRHKAHLNLALDLTHQGRLMEAASHFERVYASQLSDTATFGADDLQTLSTGHELATCWFQLGHQKKDDHLQVKARSLHKDVLERQLRNRDIDPLDVIRTRMALGEDHYRLKEYPEAKEQFNAGAMSLTSLKSAPGGKEGAKEAGNQADIDHRLREIESLLRHCNKMCTKSKAAMDKSMKAKQDSQPRSSTPQSADKREGSKGENKKTPARHTKSPSIPPTPLIEVDETPTPVVNKVTRRKSHTGARSTSPAHDRPPCASASDLLTPRQAKQRSSSNPPPAENLLSQSKGSHELHISPSRKSWSVIGTQLCPSAEQKPQEDVDHSERSRLGQERPRKTNTSEYRSREWTSNNRKMEQQQQQQQQRLLPPLSPDRHRHLPEENQGHTSFREPECSDTADKAGKEPPPPLPESLLSCNIPRNLAGEKQTHPGSEKRRTKTPEPPVSTHKRRDLTDNLKTEKPPPPPQNNPRNSTEGKQRQPEAGQRQSKVPELPPSAKASASPEPEAASQPRRDSLPERLSITPLPAMVGTLYDSRAGGSSYGSEMWLRDLVTKTHALLVPLQTAAFKRVKVAVLDTGVHMGQINFWDKDRAEIVKGKNPRIKKRYNFLDPNNSTDCTDLDGHGTHCVGVIRKVAPEADVYVARVARDSQEGPDVKAVIEVI